MYASCLDRIALPVAPRRLSRRALVGIGGGLAATTLAGGLGTMPTGNRVVAQGTPRPPANATGDRAAEIVALAEAAMARYDLRAVILRVTIDGEELVTAALGESMIGVPATPDMRFRNGAVAISYMSTLLLILVDQGMVGLDDPIAPWLPELPEADRVTLRMLSNMTAGYLDYVPHPEMVVANYADPFRQWTPEELIEIGVSQPRLFAPGENWDYSHTNYVILGRALERIADAPLADLLQENVLDPLGLTGTTSASTAAIPAPVLHAFSSERKEFLGIDPAVRFYEESTFWNPSWTLAEGAIQTTTIADMAASMEAIGTGALLSPESHQAQLAPDLLGFGAPLEGCPNCHTLFEGYNYGLGVVMSGLWILQNPLFGGYGGVAAYLPSQKIALAVANTFGEGSFDEQGNYRYGNASQAIFVEIASYLAPDEPPLIGG